MAGAAGRCRACYAPFVPGALRCGSCGAPVGRPSPCPHCRAEALVSPSVELRYVCDVCGGPRVPKADPSMAYSGREVPPLRKAESARRRRATFRAVGILGGVLLPVALLLVAALFAIFGPGAVVVALAFVFLVPPVALLAIGLSRARAHAAAIKPALDDAWVAAAADLTQHAGGSLSGDALAQKLGISEAQADELLTLLDVSQISAPPRARIDPQIQAGPPGYLPVQHTEVPAHDAQVAEDADVSHASPPRVAFAPDPAGGTKSEKGS